jgi:palmitoyltransferase
MGTIATIALVVLGISFMVFVTFFGRLPALRYGNTMPQTGYGLLTTESRRTPISWLYRMIWVQLPNGLTSLDQRLSEGRISTSCIRFGNYIMYDRHPSVLVRHPF